MTHSIPRFSLPFALARGSHRRSCTTTVYSHEEAEATIQACLDAMYSSAFDERDVWSVRMVLCEAIANARQHGNRSDPSRPVRVSWTVDARRVIASVEDQGTGFQADQVPDPRTPENIEKPRGRGLFLIRSYATWVRHNAVGNRITFGRRRTP